MPRTRFRTTFRVVLPPPEQDSPPGIHPAPGDATAEARPVMPLERRDGAFSHPLGLPSSPDSCVPFATRSQELAVGDAVRLIALPPQVAALPRATRRRWDYRAGEIFEVMAHTQSGQIAIVRRLRLRGEDGIQVMNVPVEYVERIFDPAGMEA